MGGPNIPEPKKPAPMPVQDDERGRAARQREATRQGSATGRESTILTGRLGDTGSGDYRGGSGSGGSGSGGGGSGGGAGGAGTTSDMGRSSILG